MEEGGQFVAESRRFLVMTCNDLGSVGDGGNRNGGWWCNRRGVKKGSRGCGGSMCNRTRRRCFGNVF